MPAVKLIALDIEDLTMLAAHLQDAVALIGDMTYQPKDQRFVALLNRYDWADADGRSPGVRRRTALRIERVQAAQIQGLDLAAKGQAVNLLTARFEPEAADMPGGIVTLVFAGNAAIRLHVECIELQLEDLGPSWAAQAMPDHR
jgi:Protein of unknown function (DUF2948)